MGDRRGEVVAEAGRWMLNGQKGTDCRPPLSLVSVLLATQCASCIARVAAGRVEHTLGDLNWLFIDSVSSSAHAFEHFYNRSVNELLSLIRIDRPFFLHTSWRLGGRLGSRSSTASRVERLPCRNLTRKCVNQLLKYRVHRMYSGTSSSHTDW